MTDAIPDDLPSQISAETLRAFPVPMVLADPRQPDCPLVYVNDAFLRVTGYQRDAVLGRNCRFLQGENTRRQDRAEIARALAERRQVTLDITNYRADGSRFVNRLMILPLSDEAGTGAGTGDEAAPPRYFLGVQMVRDGDTSYADRAAELDDRLRELQHRVKNHLALILAMIRVEAAGATDAQAYARVLSRRVETLSLLYDEFAQTTATTEEVAVGPYLARIAEAIHAVAGRPGVALDIRVDEAPRTLAVAGQLGLYLSEVLTNSFQHAFAEGDAGRVRVAFETSGDAQGALSLLVEDDGVGMPEGAWPRTDSLGGRIVQELVRRMGSTLRTESGPGGIGTRIALDLPAG